MSRLKPMNARKRIADGRPVPVSGEVNLAFNPAEHRDSHGRWTKGPSLADIEKAIGGTVFKSPPPSTTPNILTEKGLLASTKRILLKHLDTIVAARGRSNLFGDMSGEQAAKEGEARNAVTSILKNYDSLYDDPEVVSALKRANLGRMVPRTPEQQAKAAAAVDAMLKVRQKNADLKRWLHDLNNDVSDYEFNSVLGGETSGLETKIKQTLKDHPELLKNRKAKALLKDHPELTGIPPTYAQASADYDWAEMDPQGELPGDGPSVHVEHEAQIASEFWHDTLPEDAPDDEHYAKSLWEAYQNPNQYGSINSMLRTGKRSEDSNATVEEMRHYVDVMFEKAGTTTKKPIRLYRALHSSNQTEATGIPNWAETLTPGSTFTDKGLMSCTAHGKYAQGWLALDPKGAEVDAEKPSDVVLELRVPAGQRIVGGSKQFIETMLPPGTSIKVISSEKRTADAPVNPLGATPEDPFTYTHVVAEVLPK